MKIQLASLLLVLSVTSLALARQQPTTEPTTGLHVANPAWFVLRGATVHIDAQRHLENAVIVVHGEKIVAVGAEATAPQGAHEIDLTGKHVYPGFINGYLPWDSSSVSRQATAYWNQQIRPELRVVDGLDLSKLGREELRKAGFTAALLAPTEGIVRGTSCLVHLSDSPPQQATLRPEVAMHAQLTARFRFGGREAGEGPTYPTSPMGAYALARQALYDAVWYRDAWRRQKRSAPAAARAKRDPGGLAVAVGRRPAAGRPNQQRVVCLAGRPIRPRVRAAVDVVGQALSISRICCCISVC